MVRPECGRRPIRNLPIEKARGRFPGAGSKKFCDDEDMPVICPTCQIFSLTSPSIARRRFYSNPCTGGAVFAAITGGGAFAAPVSTGLATGNGFTLAAACCWVPASGVPRRLALHAGRAGAVRNAQLPRNARSRVQRYIQSTLPPPRPPVPERPRPIPRPKPHFRRASGHLLHRKTMTLRSPPQQAISSSRFPLDSTRRTLEKCGGTKVARRQSPFRFKAPDSKSPRRFPARAFATPATMQICR